MFLTWGRIWPILMIEPYAYIALIAYVVFCWKDLQTVHTYIRPNKTSDLMGLFDTLMAYLIFLKEFIKNISADEIIRIQKYPVCKES